MGNVVGTILDKVRDPLENYVENYVSTHASYTLRVGHHVQVLGKEIEILKKKRMDIENDILIAQRAGQVATNEVQGWLKAVEELEKDAHSITSKYSDRKCVFLGDCSLDCFSNHSIGAHAVKVNARVREESGKRDGFTTITMEAPLPAAQLVPVEPLAETSRSEINLKLGEALDFLRSDSGASLGIWGMGGVGKTTLLRHINNALAKDPSFGFDRVVFVTASRDCTAEKVQKLIVEELKLKSATANPKKDIYNYLSNKNFVILLDDLWARLDLLEEVGVPPLGMLGGLKQKLVLTTRIEQVCHYMDASRKMKVHCLSREAARLLFREKVGEDVINSDPLIPALADKVADKCDGLPKAIICIARAMSGKRRPNLWVKAIEDLQRSNFSMVPGMEDPLPLLKVSYDYLEDPMMQESLLLCALWPEDYQIPRGDVIDCWMGHGLLGEFESMDEADNNGDEIIDKLEKASLLEYFEHEDGQCHVSLHDLIRDMALWIARECGSNPKKWIILDKAPQDVKSWTEARKMSIMRSKLTTLPSVMCSGSNLTTLIIKYTALCHNDLGILQHLHQLVYLDLSHNYEIARFPIEVCRLHKLEFLDLSCTGIGELPDELQNLKNLKYLLLQDTPVTEISSQVLSCLVSLEVLNAFISDWKDDTPSPTMVDSLACLRRPLKALSIVVYSMSDLTKLTRMSGVMSVRRLCISLRDEDDQFTICMLPPNSWSRCEEMHIDGFRSSCTKLVMDGKNIPSLVRLSIGEFAFLREIIWKGVEPRNMNIRVINIGICYQLKHVTWLKDLPSLECLNLSDCTNLQQVVFKEATEAEKMEEKRKHAFLSLKSLSLIKLPELETICNHEMTFPSLRYLYVSGCKKLKKLPLDSCPMLTKIECKEEWWKNLELNEDTRTSLQPSAKLQKTRYFY